MPTLGRFGFWIRPASTQGRTRTKLPTRHSRGGFRPKSEANLATGTTGLFFIAMYGTLTILCAHDFRKTNVSRALMQKYKSSGDS